MSFKRFEKTPGVPDPLAAKRKAEEAVDYDDIFAQLEKDVDNMENMSRSTDQKPEASTSHTKKKVKKAPPKEKPMTKEEQEKAAYY